MMMDVLTNAEQFSKKLYFKKNSAIYQTGDEIDNIYFLEQGIVKLAEDAGDGHPVTISLLQEGELFGYLDYFNNRFEHTQYSVALTDVAVIAFPLDIILKHLENLTEFERAFFKMIAKQLSDAQNLVYVHSKLSVPERLGWFLKKLATSSNGKAVINIPLTHEEIAYMVGCSRQKVTTYLNKWKKEGIIEYDRGFIQLVEVDQMN
ncbi:Crp/Fnr family transcriptional regulator [Lysinibacillus yapensis]|nr:Crp/Fnr family transcriptional regulator [Lysinibacillus yapensis]